MSSLPPVQSSGNVYPAVMGGDGDQRAINPKDALNTLIDQKVTEKSSNIGLKKLANSLFGDKIQEIRTKISKEGTTSVEIILKEAYTKQLPNTVLHIPKEVHFNIIEAIAPAPGDSKTIGASSSNYFLYSRACFYFPDRANAPAEQSIEHLIKRVSYHWNEVSCNEIQCSLEGTLGIGFRGIPLEVTGPTPGVSNHNLDEF